MASSLLKIQICLAQKECETENLNAVMCINHVCSQIMGEESFFCQKGHILCSLAVQI